MKELRIVIEVDYICIKMEERSFIILFYILVLLYKFDFIIYKFFLFLYVFF